MQAQDEDLTVGVYRFSLEEGGRHRWVPLPPPYDGAGPRTQAVLFKAGTGFEDWVEVSLVEDKSAVVIRTGRGLVVRPLVSNHIVVEVETR